VVTASSGNFLRLAFVAMALLSTAVPSFSATVACGCCPRTGELAPVATKEAGCCDGGRTDGHQQPDGNDSGHQEPCSSGACALPCCRVALPATRLPGPPIDVERSDQPTALPDAVPVAPTGEAIFHPPRA
jgi:hypothetical protein